MGNITKKLQTVYQYREYNSLYSAWIKNNTIFYNRYYTLIALSITALLIPFDFLLYKEPVIYTSARTFLLSLYIIQLCIIFKYKKTKYNGFLNILILITPLSYNLAYSYFLFKADVAESYYLTLLLATFFVIIISNIFIYKFYKEQYALVLLSISVLFLVSIYKPEISSDIIKLILFHIISTLICVYYRYRFSVSLLNKYQYLSSLLPNKFAKLVSISDKDLDIRELFPTKEYFAVCLCSDWRNYQKITNSTSNNEVGKIIEKFYTIIYKSLERLNINGQYYADWTADELFIIFYGEEKEKELVKSQALNFCHSLATTLYVDISKEVNKNIMYDIGLSSGYGLIGLQGPVNFKKTTITGDVAGNSKRYETQAKKIRKETDLNSFPIIVMDKELSNQAHNFDSYKNNMISNKIKGSVKDIINYDLISWVFCNKEKLK